VSAKSNNRVTCDSDPNFYLRYKNVSVGSPQTFTENMTREDITPQQCRLRDMTYAAPLMVDVEYTKGREIITKKGVCIGKIPLMLRSSRCYLRNKSEDELADLGECPLDPGGYFVVKGVEKVILIQEQLSKNRVIIERDSKGLICASVTSSTHERKSKTNLVQKNGKIYLRHNTFQEDIPIVIALKAMGLESDQELMQKAAGGSDPVCMSLLAPSLQECATNDVYTQAQALDFCGQRIRASQWRLTAIAGKEGKAAAQAAAVEMAGPGNENNNNAAAAAAGNYNNNITNDTNGVGKDNRDANHINIHRRTRADEARDIFAGVVLAHVPVEDYDFRGKSAYVCVMIRRILLANSNPDEIDDKDYYGNKRLELAGQLLALLFEDCFKRLNADLKRQADAVLSKANRAQQFDVLKCIRQDTISNGLEHAISTGNWTVKRFRMERKGVTQVLSRLSFISALGMMTRITSQFEKTRKVSGPRALQPSQWGMLCPSDTPEGESCGLVKNLALMTHVTTDSDEGPLRKLAKALGCEPLEFLAGEELHEKDCALVLLNGSILGSVSQPLQFADKFRKLRRSGRVSEFVSVHVTKGFVHIASDGGRVCRPLIIVDERTGQLKMKQKHLDALKRNEWKFDDFLRRGYVEYLDVNEENDTYIALHEKDLTPQHTHCEIEPFTMLGVCAGIIPYPHHNQSPRNTYQCAMGKQAMGNLAFNQLNRMDTLMYTLCSAQKPLVTTKTINLIEYDRLGAGQNAVIAVLSNTGYDIEDAVVINKASLDRGFGRCQVSRKYSATLKKYANRSSDKVMAPTQDQLKKMKNYQVLDTDGFAQPGVRIRNKDIYVNKHSPKNTREPIANPEQLHDREYRSSPQMYRGPEVDDCIVDKVMLTTTDENQFVVKTLVRHTRRPEVGDKFSSRHGQKGVVGAILSQEDFPITERGICPDLVMNPHGFPSRMTVGKLIELLAGKAASEEGKFGDASAFGSNDISASSSSTSGTNKNESVDEIGELLLKAGYASDGKETLICGLTGEYLQARIFTGPVYYQKLKHMVLDKMHARARGPRVVLTRQPTEGRARQGGLRLGEMERDCLIGYGASALVLERLMISADSFDAAVCQNCGLLAYRDKQTGRDCCISCGTDAEVATLKVPYACKLLFQELQSMNICPRISLDEA
jgi:DNA-directed RNA polymerase III subunit RPC2